MTPCISVVFSAHQERQSDIDQTIESIRKSDGGHFAEIVIVDDSSTEQVNPRGEKLIRNMHRLGVGRSRHIGIEAASSPLIFLCDAHCIFDPSWLPATLDHLNGNSRLLLCGHCIALHESHRDLSQPIGHYWGAKMHILDEHEADIRWRILTAKWANEKPEPFYRLSAVSGACYGFHRKFFLDFGGSRMLRNWGGDEENLSLKTLLCGGEICLSKLVRVGHKFRTKTKPPYRITVDDCVYNSILLAHTCCPPEVAKDLISKIGPGVEVINAKEMIRVNRAAIDAERARLEKIFTRSWDEYVKLIAQIE